MKARVFVVDDHPIVRGGLAQLINQEADLHVCGEAADAATAFDAIEALKPDVAVVDLSLHGPDGLELVKNLRARHIPVPVVILSMHDESLYAERALRAGARAYLMKQEAAEQVLVALRRVLAGDIYVSDRMASRLLGQMTGAPSVCGRLAASLPERSRARRVPAHRSRQRHAADRRRIAPERQDRGVVSHAHQGKTRPELSGRAGALRGRVVRRDRPDAA